MAHIDLPPGLPGIRGLLAFRPEAAAPLGELTDVLLHGPGSLPAGERELIAAYVSALNECTYCRASHAAIAACHLHDDGLVASVVADPESAPIPEKLKALLAVAGRVQQGGHAVRRDDITRARRAGASDMDLHDTVLIAALFCLFNRYVDGLATSTPTDAEGYRQRAAFVAAHGYAAVVATTAKAAAGGA